MNGHTNQGFEDDNPGQLKDSSKNGSIPPADPEESPDQSVPKIQEREVWGKDIEFLMSCIAMSVGLGNVWRFPFTALENGGGAFVIPYLIVLFLVGKPLYYLEMLIGQFASRGSVKVYDFCPAMRGIGVAQLISTAWVTTYYASLMCLTLYYFFASMASVLPWSMCREEWGPDCISSGVIDIQPNSSQKFTSAELYFLKEVLKEVSSIADGIGLPDWRLLLCLIGSWIVVYLLLIRGIKSSGKASYFLAIFPYIIMIVLLVRAATLPGAVDGIIFFIKPNWEKILEPRVWYAAVTQMFFSLAVGFGNIINYASYNRFKHDVYRDATIVTLLDTATSLLAGFTIFGILGHLAYVVESDDVGTVVKGGTGLAFISYPDAIAKFESVPQLFSVLFFLMLFVLGVGSGIGMTSSLMTGIRDFFPKLKNWHAGLGIVVTSTLIGTMYVTPGGQYMLNWIDYYGASFVVYIMAIGELIALGWIYGVRRICKDVEFMNGRKLGFYWRICWGVITPGLMLAILIYTFVDYQPLQYKGQDYPTWSYALGWCISVLGLIQLPLWAWAAIMKQPGSSILHKIRDSFQPKEKWGPSNSATLAEYTKTLMEDDDEIEFEKAGLLKKMWLNVFG